ncbi:alpha/beta hydrolase family esterase [Adhaeribacter rhizoryzae]|uniref:Poly(3-hydroxybutyrate) depolymerase n=1 Tax=Adhaeribacter rhizoryzae TaxID=2607907 RepID=A0A5M6DBQ8_9BACT|nr:poly(3-hydroxybutyrate) depolymerase [Adhaeribacter rhizoryzae]KAA5544967.1 poly(3-hydroxybutyrate) depolymerase [Adhaeribacter rhizoryzae]
MTKYILLVLFLTSFFTAKSQVLTDSVLVENHYRTFHFNKPSQATKNYHLIFVLHGSGGDGKGMLKPAANFEKVAGREQFFLVYPDGYKRYWNECRKMATSVANLQNINEQAFFEAMVRYFKKHYQVKDQQFFAIGLSGGGHMAYKLALTMPDKCKGISAVVANLPDTDNLDCAELKKPVAVMIINGTKDSVNPYEGGPMVVNGSSFGTVLSTNSNFNYWASIAGYKGKPVVEALPDTNPANKQTITRYTFKATGKPEVTLLKVEGGEHAFPGDVDAFIESGKFFKRQIASKL